MRYETPDQNGETRRERNARFDEPSPELIIPDEGLYLWEWFDDICEGINRVHDTTVFRITPSDFTSWATITGNIVRTEEYAILRAMDAAYSLELTTELAAHRQRAQEQAERERAQK